MPHQVGHRVGYDLTYKPRTTIKAQALADFLADLTFSISQEAILDDVELQKWTLYVDRPSNSDGSGAGLLPEDPHGETCSYALRFDLPLPTMKPNTKQSSRAYN